MFPKRHLSRNLSVIFRRLFQTTKNPEVSNVFSVCGSFQPLPKNCGPFLKFWDFCSVAVEPRYFAVASCAWTRWPFLAGFWPLLPGFGRFWPVLGPFFSQFRAAFVGFWSFLAGLFWPKGAKRAPYPLDLEFRQLQIFGRFLAGVWPFF